MSFYNSNLFSPFQKDYQNLNQGNLSPYQTVPSMSPAGMMVGAGIGKLIDFGSNMILSKYQHDKNMYLWNKQNEYNHPVNQMARLRQAGINPNMAFMRGTINNVSSNQTPKYQAPSMSMSEAVPMTAGVLNQYQDYQIKGAQYDNLKAQEESIQLNNTKQKLMNRLLLETLPFRKDLPKLDLEIKSRIRSMKDLENQLFQETYNYRKGKVKADSEILSSQADMWKDYINPADAVWYRLIKLFYDKGGLGKAKDLWNWNFGK